MPEDDNVVSFQSPKTTSGAAMCMNCKHKWTAVAPSGTICLECPACESMNGIWHMPIFPDSREMFACGNCDQVYMVIQRDGFMCVSCGIYVDWDQYNGVQ